MHVTQQAVNTYTMHSMILSISPKFHVDDKVRITRKKCTFEKGFTPNWIGEVFTISSVKDTKPPTYTIKGTLGEPIHGTFYEQELQLSVQGIFRIERVLGKKKIKYLSCGKVTVKHSIRGYR